METQFDEFEYFEEESLLQYVIYDKELLWTVHSSSRNPGLQSVQR
jgi:hypothetical protein